MPPNASAPRTTVGFGANPQVKAPVAAAAASMPVKNNGFGPVIKHMDTLKELLDKLSAKLRGVSPNNGLGTNPLEAIQVNIPPQAKARGNGLGNNPLEGIQVNIPPPEKPKNNGASGKSGKGAKLPGKSAENQYAATRAGLNPVTPGNVGKGSQQTSTQGQPKNNQKVSVKNRKAAIEAKLKKTRKNRKSSRKNTRRN